MPSLTPNLDEVRRRMREPFGVVQPAPQGTPQPKKPKPQPKKKQPKPEKTGQSLKGILKAAGLLPE